MNIYRFFITIRIVHMLMVQYVNITYKETTKKIKFSALT